MIKFVIMKHRDDVYQVVSSLGLIYGTFSNYDDALVQIKLINSIGIEKDDMENKNI
jgi:hypothetical protein